MRSFSGLAFLDLGAGEVGVVGVVGVARARSEWSATELRVLH
jgi:hypothetical protein